MKTTIMAKTTKMRISTPNEMDTPSTTVKDGAGTAGMTTEELDTACVYNV